MKGKKSNVKQVTRKNNPSTYVIPTNMKVSLKKIADKKHESVSVIVRQALREYIEIHE